MPTGQYGGWITTAPNWATVAATTGWATTTTANQWTTTYEYRPPVTTNWAAAITTWDTGIYNTALKEMLDRYYGTKSEKMPCEKDILDLL